MSRQQADWDRGFKTIDEALGDGWKTEAKTALEARMAEIGAEIEKAEGTLANSVVAGWHLTEVAKQTLPTLKDYRDQLERKVKSLDSIGKQTFDHSAGRMFAFLQASETGGDPEVVVMLFKDARPWNGEKICINGKANPGETYQQTANREVKEEFFNHPVFRNIIARSSSDEQEYFDLDNTNVVQRLLATSGIYLSRMGVWLDNSKVYTKEELDGMMASLSTAMTRMVGNTKNLIDFKFNGFEADRHGNKVSLGDLGKNIAALKEWKGEKDSDCPLSEDTMKALEAAFEALKADASKEAGIKDLVGDVMDFTESTAVRTVPFSELAEHPALNPSAKADDVKAAVKIFNPNIERLKLQAGDIGENLKAQKAAALVGLGFSSGAAAAAAGAGAFAAAGAGAAAGGGDVVMTPAPKV